MVAIGLTWLFIVAALLIAPAARTDPGALARTALIALAAAIWWWGWFEVLDRMRLWLRGRPELRDWKRILAYVVAMVAYPALSFAMLVIASR